MFLVAYKFQSDKLTDISYALSFAVLAVVAFVQGPKGSFQVVALAMVLAWAIRIGGFLLYRVMKIGKDSRFDKIRRDFKKFGTFWLGQAITVWVLMIPALLTLQSHVDGGWMSVLGICIWLLGLAIESVADFQKFAFSQNPKNKGRWIDSGIWHYSRHPNYFGEILVWVGMYVFSLAFLAPAQAAIGLVSPVTILILLLFISGIPPLEKMADKRWGHLADYKTYKKSTSVLIPFFKSR